MMNPDDNKSRVNLGHGPKGVDGGLNHKFYSYGKESEHPRHENVKVGRPDSVCPLVLIVDMFRFLDAFKVGKQVKRQRFSTKRMENIRLKKYLLS